MRHIPRPHCTISNAAYMMNSLVFSMFLFFLVPLSPCKISCRIENTVEFNPGFLSLFQWNGFSGSRCHTLTFWGGVKYECGHRMGRKVSVTLDMAREC